MNQRMFGGRVCAAATAEPARKVRRVIMQTMLQAIAGLVFIGATNDRRFRAFDKDTGKELWVTKLPASGHATPLTFLGKKSKKQFVVIAAGGGHKYNPKHPDGYSDSLAAADFVGL
jgi:quinoprotein glucose dehydrogenase